MQLLWLQITMKHCITKTYTFSSWSVTNWLHNIWMFHYIDFANNLFLCRLTKVTKLICYLKKDQVTENCNPCWTLSCELCTTKFTRRPNLNTQMKALHDIIKACMYWQKHFLLPCQVTDHFESHWRSVQWLWEKG